MVYKFFDKETSGCAVKSEIMPNQEFAEELQKPLLENSKNENYSSFIDNIWGSDLANVQLIRKFNKGICFSICVIDIFSKYAWVIPLKEKKGITITEAFQKILDESNRKSNKMWVDKRTTKKNLLLLKDFLEP